MSTKQYLINETTVEDSWRLFHILAEFVEGFETLNDCRPAVSVFGSTRVRPGDGVYEKAELIGRLLAQNGFSVITGGGPGVMEAANKGAAEAGGKSIGLNIQLPDGTETQSLCQHPFELPLLLRPEGDVCQVCHGVHHPPRGLWNDG